MRLVPPNQDTTRYEQSSKTWSDSNTTGTYGFLARRFADLPDRTSLWPLRNPRDGSAWPADGCPELWLRHWFMAFVWATSWAAVLFKIAASPGEAGNLLWRESHV